MDRVAAVAVVDPDHHESAAGQGLSDRLFRLAAGNLRIDSSGITKDLFDLLNGDAPFGMIRAEVPAVSSIPDDRPIVHPLSICEKDGQIGVASGT